MTSGADTTQIVIYDPKEQDKQLALAAESARDVGGAGAFAGGLLTACVNGQVFLLDPEASGDMARPLQPAVEGINTWEWRPPVAVDDKLAVLSDGDKRLMAIRISSDGEKALAGAASVTDEECLVSPRRRLGQGCFRRRSRRGRFDRQPAELRIAESHARQVAGPGGALRLGAAARGQVGAGGHREEPLAGDRPSSRRWSGSRSWAMARWPARRILSGDEIFLSARSGTVWRISAADGKELGKVDAGCPLGTGPLVVGSRVIVGGHEGSLLEVKKP